MTYDLLVADRTEPQSIARWANVGNLPPEVVLDDAQLMIYRCLRVQEMKARTLGAIASGESSIALPDNFLECLRFRIEGICDDDVNERLPEDLESLREYSSGVLSSKAPGDFAIMSSSLQFSGSADGTYYYSMVYYFQPPLLGPNNQTNFLTTKHTGLIRAACQVVVAGYMKDREAAAYWDQEFTKWLVSAKGEDNNNKGRVRPISDLDGVDSVGIGNNARFS